MVTHDKTIYCKQCRQIGRIKQEWFKSRCRDCHLFGSSWYYFLLFRLMSQHRDDQETLKRLNRKVNSILRWITQDLEPSLRHTHTQLPEESLLKLLTIADK